MEEDLENKELDTKEVVSQLLSARHITKVIYVDEDFDFVYDFIKSHCPNAK